MSGAEPFLRWAGSKRWFVPQFANDMLEQVRTCRYYIEPFLGGGAMALWLASQGHASKMKLGDVEEELITAYSTLVSNPDGVLQLLRSLFEFGTSEEVYYQVRGTSPETDEESAARTIYLNRLCFNGLYRKNKSGEFNVPYGKKQKDLHEDVLQAAAIALQGATFVAGDFELLTDWASQGDVIYADPPYDGGFVDYSSDSFLAGDQRRLAASLRAARKRGATVFAHNADTPLIREIYGWAELLPIEEKRRINSNGQDRGEVGCLFIVAGG